MSDAPIGRRKVFQDIRSRLASPEPGVITVAGTAGSGRTHLLRFLALAAEGLGYKVLQGTDAEPLAIEPSTTTADVRRRLQNLITDSTKLEGLAPNDISELHDMDRQIITLFRCSSPLLVPIDGFRPAPTFGSWFTSVLIPMLRTSGDRVAVVITDRAEALQSLSELADLAVTLGRLDADEVRTALRRAASGFSPELSSGELDRYVEAAVVQPATLSSLLGVFDACGPAHTTAVAT